MKRIIIATILSMLLVACTHSFFSPNDMNLFYKDTTSIVGKSRMYLQFSNDNTFIASRDNKDYSGKWEMKYQTRITLIFDEITDVELFLTLGRVYQGEMDVEVLSTNKILFDDVILKRQRN